MGLENRSFAEICTTEGNRDQQWAEGAPSAERPGERIPPHSENLTSRPWHHLQLNDKIKKARKKIWL